MYSVLRKSQGIIKYIFVWGLWRWVVHFCLLETGKHKTEPEVGRLHLCLCVIVYEHASKDKEYQRWWSEGEDKITGCDHISK